MFFESGVFVKMITGDVLETVLAIGERGVESGVRKKGFVRFF